MTRNRPHSLLIAAVLIGLVALVVAGCGSGGQATAAMRREWGLLRVM